MRLADDVFCRIERTWLAAVFALMNKVAAMSRFERPRVTSCSTSISRSVRPSGRCGPATTEDAAGPPAWLRRAAIHDCISWSLDRQTGAPLRSTRARASTAAASARSGFPISSAIPARRRSAGPTHALKPAASVRPAKRSSSVSSGAAWDVSSRIRHVSARKDRAMGHRLSRGTERNPSGASEASIWRASSRRPSSA